MENVMTVNIRIIVKVDVGLLLMHKQEVLKEKMEHVI